MDARLYIGTRRYSSWSLRGWLLVRLAGLAAEEIVIPLRDGASPTVSAVSPNGMVPYLEHGGAKIWESLAIAEYCAEIFPPLWPAETVARAHARAISAEMHAGFRNLRIAMPMNLGREFAGRRQTPEALADIARIDMIWSQTIARFGGGPFLFGQNFTAADAMFAPVVARFLSFKPALSAEARSYCAAVRLHPLMVEWCDLAAREPVEWQLEKYENIT